MIPDHPKVHTFPNAISDRRPQIILLSIFGSHYFKFVTSAGKVTLFWAAQIGTSHPPKQDERIGVGGSFFFGLQVV